jgi:hypothetical protein
MPFKSDVQSPKFEFSEMSDDLDITSLQFQDPTTTLQSSINEQGDTLNNTKSQLSVANTTQTTNHSLKQPSGGIIPFFNTSTVKFSILRPQIRTSNGSRLKTSITILKNHNTKNSFLKSGFNFTNGKANNYSNITSNLKSDGSLVYQNFLFRVFAVSFMLIMIFN